MGSVIKGASVGVRVSVFGAVDTSTTTNKSHGIYLMFTLQTSSGFRRFFRGLNGVVGHYVIDAGDGGL